MESTESLFGTPGMVSHFLPIVIGLALAPSAIHRMEPAWLLGIQMGKYELLKRFIDHFTHSKASGFMRMDRLFLNVSFP